MLTPDEALAHLTILDTVRMVTERRFHKAYAPGALRRPLETFRPRCNCRRVLNWSAWADGLREAWCVCGARVREAA